jgi:hypothetical protein
VPTSPRFPVLAGCGPPVDSRTAGLGGVDHTGRGRTRGVVWWFILAAFWR